MHIKTNNEGNTMNYTNAYARLAPLTNGQLVKVYKNLHKDCYSVVALDGEFKGRVIAHAKSIVLSDAVTKVSEAGRQRVIREKAKNVHAVVVGRVALHKMVDIRSFNAVSYNPYKAGHFYFKADQFPFYGARSVVLNEAGMVASK